MYEQREDVEKQKGQENASFFLKLQLLPLAMDQQTTLLIRLTSRVRQLPSDSDLLNIPENFSNII